MTNYWSFFAFSFMGLIAFVLAGPPSEKGGFGQPSKGIEHGYPHQPNYPEHKPIQQHHQPVQQHHQPIMQHKPAKEHHQPVIEYKPIVEYKPVVVHKPVVEHKPVIVHHKQPAVVEHKPNNHHQPHQTQHKPHHNKCGQPGPEVLKCLSEWTCQNLVRLDFRKCLTNINGNQILGDFWRQQNHNLMGLLHNN